MYIIKLKNVEIIPKYENMYIFPKQHIDFGRAIKLD